MHELTKEQIEAAIKAAQIPYWDNDNDFWEQALVAAAPYLQYPIAPATDDEVKDICRISNERPFEWFSTNRILAAFVACRNAALAPKPTKREQLEELIQYWLPGRIEERKELADRIEALYKDEK